MQKLATNEKRLLVLLSGALFIALNLITFKLFLNTKEGLQKEVMSTRSKISEGASTLTLAESLKPAEEWIQTHPFANKKADQASEELLALERQEAEKNNLKVDEENILPPSTSDNISSVTLQIKLSGPFSGVVKFLFALQSPTAWRSIDNFTIKSDTEQSNVLMELEVKQYFHNMPGDSSLDNTSEQQDSSNDAS